MELGHHGRFVAPHHPFEAGRRVGPHAALETEPLGGGLAQSPHPPAKTHGANVRRPLAAEEIEDVLKVVLDVRLPSVLVDPSPEVWLAGSGGA